MPFAPFSLLTYPYSFHNHITGKFGFIFVHNFEILAPKEGIF